MPKLPSITPRKVTGKAKPWQLNIPATISETGKRQRLYFATKKEGEAHAALIVKRREEFGTKTVLLSPAVRKQAVEACDELRGLDVSLSGAVHEYVAACEAARAAGGTLTDAVEHFVAWKAQVEQSVTLDELFQEFISTKQLNGISDSYVNQLNSVRRRFVPLFGETPVCDISARSLSAVLRDLELGKATYNASLRVLSAAFTYAVNHEYAADNPVKKIEKAKLGAREVKILTNEQTAALVEVADFDFRPYFLFGLFAGLRPTETQRLRWEDVDLEERRIFVNSSANQKEQIGRFVPIESNLYEWLKSYAGSVGSVVSSKGFRQRFEASRESADELLRKAESKVLVKKPESAAKLSSQWDADCLRHTAASNWGALHSDIPKVCMWLGHTEKVHRKHYHRPIPRSQADHFWAIAPKRGMGRKVLPIATAKIVG